MRRISPLFGIEGHMGKNRQNSAWVKIAVMLLCLIGVGSAWADVWDGVSKTRAKTTNIDGVEYFLIESAANLAWFSDSVNNYVLEQKWNKMVTAINNDDSKTEIFKEEAISLMEAIRLDPELYYTDPEKKALWNKSPYRGYLETARGMEVTVKMNAKITAEYLDMNGYPFIPIASGMGSNKFGGTFDGNNVTIKNLKVDSKTFKFRFYDVLVGYPLDCQNVGLFGVIGKEGVVKNVVLDGATILATGKNDYWTNTNQVSVGPIVGWMDGGTIDACYASGLVITNGRDVGAGGILGAMRKGSVTNSLTTVSVEASGKDVYVGGVVGVIRGSASILSTVYDGEKLVAHPDEIGAEGAIAGRVVNMNSIDGETGLPKGTETENMNRCFYDKDILNLMIGSKDPLVIINGDVNGVSKNNTPENVCKLNGHEWSNGSCSDSTGIWSNQENITNKGVAKNDEGETVFLITFNANGGSFTNGAKKTKILTFRSPLTADEISIPTYESKKFIGWSLNSSATAADENLGVVYGPKTVYAVWKDVKNYTIVFDFNTGDGATQLKKSVAKGDEISTEGFDAAELPSVYASGDKEYYFKGWSATKTGAILETLGTATKDATFYAQWTLSPTYKVTYVMNGHGVAPAEEFVAEGERAVGPSQPAADGYVFGGWYTEELCLNAYDFKTVLKSNIVLYAKWTPAVYDIVYNLNGGVNHVGNPSSYTIESPDIVIKNPSKEGFVFKGWYYDGSFSNQASQITHGSTGNVTLYANWQLNVYTINYIAGEIGAGNFEPVTKKHGETVRLLGEVYVTAGYIQDGWSTSDGGAKVYELNADYSANANVDLFPHWAVANYTITYHNVEEAVNENPATYQRDTVNALTLLSPTRVGYKFDGWYETADFTGNKITKIEKKTFGNRDFYAKWSPIAVTINVTGQSFTYDGKMHGAKVSVTGLPGAYKYEAVTDSVKNVAEGAVPVTCVSFIIRDKTTNEDVTAKFVGLSITTDGTISISPRVVNFTGKDANETYSGEKITTSTAATASNLLSTHSHNVVSTATGTDVGTYPGVMTASASVKILDADGNDVTSNYSIGTITPATKGLTISKKSGTFKITLGTQAFTVDGAPHAMTILPTSEAATGETEFKYQFAGASTWTNDLSTLTKTEAGTYTINVQATNPNYTGTATTTGKLILTDKTVVTVMAKDASKVYDGTPLTESGYFFSGTVKDGDVLEVIIGSSLTDVGSAENAVTGCSVTRGGADVSDEYICNTVSGLLTVTKAPLTIKTDAAMRAYDGTALTAEASVTGLVNGETMDVSATGSQTQVGTSVNSYSVTGGTAKLSNYAVTEDLGVLTVTTAAVTIEVAEGAKLYGDADPVFDGVVVGLVNPEDLGTIKYYRTNPTVRKVGTYAGVITASYKANPNYSVTVVPAKFTINKRNVTLTSPSVTKVYDGVALTAPNIIVGGDGFAVDEGAIFTVTGSRTDAGSSSNAFTYVLKEGTDTTLNYVIQKPVVGTLTVTKSPVNVTITGHSNTYAYNGLEQVVAGYDVVIDNALYSVNKIAFSGDSVIRKKNSGNYTMGLAVSKFANKDANFDVTFNVTDGSLVITPPVAIVSYNDHGDTLHVVIHENDSDSQVSDKINDALAGHVPPIPLPTKDSDGDSTYAFGGWKVNPGTGRYEADFVGSVKLDTIKVKYQDSPEKYIDVTIHVTDLYKDIVEKINATLEENGIPLPSKAADGDSTYTLQWKKNSDNIYEADFKGVAITETIVVHYGNGESDTIHVDIRPKDSDSEINRKIFEALDNHLPPIKVTQKDSSYTLVGWKKDEKTGWYEPSFVKGELVFRINFHLPEGAELVDEFEGYKYGQVTLLPKAVMKSDSAWIFKGWYTRTKGRGDHVKAMRETDYGNKSLYPLFQKTLRYDAKGKTGVIEVIYTSEAETVVARALASVVPADYTKNGRTYTFDKWVLKDGVYEATFKEVGANFNVFAESRALVIEDAKIGANLTIFDMGGRIVKRGTISNGSQRVELPKSGSYTVRVNREAVQVNVK